VPASVVRASKMLDDLIGYLRAAMPHMRDSSSTLAQEVELARAWLAIAGSPPDGYLNVAIDVPAGAESIRMPPMLLLPLLAGAIPPGGETRGATVSIACSVTASLVRVTLATRGFADAPPAKGSDAVAARLDALYGGNGRLVTRVTTSREAETTVEFPRE
jgi:LytS/YehU family sensor histidine kinase